MQPHLRVRRGRPGSGSSAGRGSAAVAIAREPYPASSSQNPTKSLLVADAGLERRAAGRPARSPACRRGWPRTRRASRGGPGAGPSARLAGSAPKKSFRRRGLAQLGERGRRLAAPLVERLAALGGDRVALAPPAAALALLGHVARPSRAARARCRAARAEASRSSRPTRRRAASARTGVDSPASSSSPRTMYEMGVSRSSCISPT